MISREIPNYSHNLPEVPLIKCSNTGGGTVWPTHSEGASAEKHNYKSGGPPSREPLTHNIRTEEETRRWCCGWCLLTRERDDLVVFYQVVGSRKEAAMLPPNVILIKVITYIPPLIANCPLHSKIVLIRAINDHTSFGWGELTMMCMKKIYRWTMAIKFANNSFIRQLNSLWVSGRGGGDILTESKLVLFIRLPFYSPSSYPLPQTRTSTYYIVYIHRSRGICARDYFIVLPPPREFTERSCSVSLPFLYYHHHSRSYCIVTGRLPFFFFSI